MASDNSQNKYIGIIVDYYIWGFMTMKEREREKKARLQYVEKMEQIKIVHKGPPMLYFKS